MSDDCPNELTELAKEYIKSLEADPDGASEELREELQYWEEQVGEFEEGTPMHEMAVEERDEIQERIDGIEAKGERREELRTELLMRASKEFAPQDKWLESVVVEALSHGLTGQRMNGLVVGEHKLPEDADELSKREMVSVAKTIHALAGDAIGSDERIAELRNKLDTDTQRSILRLLAHHDEPLSSDSISNKLGEDGTDSPGSNIRYVRSEVDIDPYQTTDRGYTLTLAGRYVWNWYGQDAQKPAGEGDKQAIDDAKTEETTDEGEEGFTPDDESSDAADNVDLSSFEVKE